MGKFGRLLGVLVLAIIVSGGSAYAYDRAEAVAFALDQWNVPVYAGHEFPYAGPDRLPAGSAQPDYCCAEFVSRSLQAGGINIVETCPGFRQCISIFDWLLKTGNGTVVDSVDQLQAGDVIFYRKTGSVKEWSHAVLVIDPVTKNIASHNNARWNAAWSYREKITEATAYMKINDGDMIYTVLPPRDKEQLPSRHLDHPRVAKAEPKVESKVPETPQLQEYGPPAPKPEIVQEPKQEAKKPKGITRFFRKLIGHRETKPAPEASPAIEPRDDSSSAARQGRAPAPSMESVTCRPDPIEEEKRIR